MKLIPEPRSAIEMEKLTVDECKLLQARRNLLLAAHTLAQSLLTVGEPGMATLITSLADPAVHGELNDLADALMNHEGTRCGCVQVVEKFHPNEPHWRGDTEEGRTYLELGRCWCGTCETMVTAYKCHLCGHLMHTAGTIEQLALSTTEPQELHA